jgi:hypothetical protein
VNKKDVAAKSPLGEAPVVANSTNKKPEQVVPLIKLVDQPVPARKP